MDNPQIRNRLRTLIHIWRQTKQLPQEQPLLPYGFASHNENVMQEVVVRNMNDTINYLITITTIDQHVNTLSEIKTEFYKLYPQNSSYLFIPIEYIPFTFSIGTIGLFSFLQYITEWNVGITLFSFVSSFLMFLYGKNIQRANNTFSIINHLTYMYNSQTPLCQYDYGSLIQYNTFMNLLWSWIRRHPYRQELIRRLFEEVSDSIYVCRHGNMARLANIMQGFCNGLYILDADSMQSELAKISRSSATLDEKLHEAGELFNKFGYGAAERAPWLDAIREDNSFP